jgi:hypothetical protein
MLSHLLNHTQHSLSVDDIRAVADKLHGYLAGDISSLLAEAQRLCWVDDHRIARFSQNDQNANDGNMKVTVDHLRTAMLRVRPSGIVYLICLSYLNGQDSTFHLQLCRAPQLRTPTLNGQISEVKKRRNALCRKQLNGQSRIKPLSEDLAFRHPRVHFVLCAFCLFITGFNQYHVHQVFSFMALQDAAKL